MKWVKWNQDFVCMFDTSEASQIISVTAYKREDLLG